jgi:hypothetical protein
MNGGPTTVPGKVNEALYLDGVDDYIELGPNDTLKMAGGLTIECWVNWEGECAPIAGIERSYRIWIYTDGQLYCNLATTDHAWPGWGTGYMPALNEWIHLAMVYDGSNLMAYANGVKLGEDPAVGNVLDSTVPFRVGLYLVPSPNDWMFHGKIDELRLYNRGLSEAEILQNMEANFYSVTGLDKLVGTWGEIKDSDLGSPSARTW